MTGSRGTGDPGGLRYLVEYVPAAAVERVAKKHAKAIAKGASVWDYVSEDLLTKRVECADEKTALSTACRVVKLDDCGEVRVYEEQSVRESDELGSWLEWIVLRHAVFYEGDDAFEWAAWR